MIVQFWLVSILLILIVISVVVMFFIKASQKQQNNSQASRNALNKALYDVRLSEIECDDEQDIIPDKSALITELQHNLLDDINDQGTNQSIIAKQKKWLWLPAVVVLLLGGSTLYWSVGAYQEIVNWDDVMKRYPTIYNNIFAGEGYEPTEQELRDLLIGMRTHLDKNPNDAIGWLRYSRLGELFQNRELVEDSLKRAYQLDPNSIDIRLGYIGMKMQLEDQYSQKQADAMLENILKEHPENLQALSMSAFSALEKQDYAGAIKNWQKMLTLTVPNSQQADMLRGSIAYAENKMTLASISQMSRKDNEVHQQENKVAAVGPAYQVLIEVAEQVKIPSDGYLFVYAQSVNGPPMPVAAIKMKLPNFPVMVEISDANAMLEGMKLSDYPQFTIQARISVDGNVKNTEGQWKGITDAIDAGSTEQIKLLISEPL